AGQPTGCFRYTWFVAFAATLQQLNELAIQREDLAENLNAQIVCELTRYTQELKTERKSHFQDGRRAQQHIESSWKQLESVSDLCPCPPTHCPHPKLCKSGNLFGLFIFVCLLVFLLIFQSKRRFERDCKEAERAQHVSDKIDLDNKTDGEKRCSLKARQTAQQKQQAAEESRKDYVTSLNQFNQDQHQHYHTLVPVIYQRIQDMEERRIERIGEAMRSLAEAERKVLPVVSRCLDAMMEAAESIQPRKDTRQVVEVYKSGFDPPGDVEFEDYSATMRRSISESSYLDNRTEERRQSRKLWPFIRKTKVYARTHTHTQGADETHLEESPGCTQVLFSLFSCLPSCPPPASLHPHPQPLLHPGAWPTVPSPHPQPPENQSHSG
uniref:Formin binding protein 1 n=1 Tax=Haplochromis burtoni TaxID=8153 RepID=A0A3Q3BPM7_HAPBU